MPRDLRHTPAVATVTPATHAMSATHLDTGQELPQFLAHPGEARSLADPDQPHAGRSSSVRSRIVSGTTTSAISTPRAALPFS